MTRAKLADLKTAAHFRFSEKKTIFKYKYETCLLFFDIFVG